MTNKLFLEVFMKKRWILMLAGLVLCAAMAFAQGTPLTGEWEGIDDRSENGLSELTMTQVTVDGMVGYRFHGTVKSGGAVQWPYIAAQFTPGGASMTGARSSRAILFKVRGNGEKYWFSIATSDVKDWAFHRYSFQTSGDITQIRVPINLMRQPDWGLSKRLQLANTEYFQWANFDSVDSVVDFTIFDLRYE